MLLKKVSIILLVSILYLLAAHSHAWCWWFNKSDQELLQQGITCDNPKKVEKCLDTFIKKENFSAILQIRRHAQQMIRTERAKLTKQRMFSPEETRKHLAPWVKIEQKASRFFKRTEVQQGKKQNTVP